ncbi:MULTISPECIES: flavodoxin family protein [Desulfobacula]|uniref:FldA: flavodoxin n=2 Tax=Desulfobacula TaxID=28222 RepID=K0NLZ8_DESTT|nr:MULTISPECIES: NAD(P)H-dependent oxidoreductase [Desulfobacula]CCK81755.1 FldA: flavodoxin [Desulfobacula toluolica Tol2]SDT85982.1 NAD(P)H dehydrogenase (quinone) [Desulfobacula phenolica]
MKVLVLYYSKGGNTKKLAREIVEGVNSVEAVQGVLKSTDEVTKEDFIEAGGIIAGSPVYFGNMAAQLKAVFDNFVSTRRKMEGKVGAAFTTSGDPSGGKETTMMSIIQAFLIYGMVITGDPLSATGHYGVACVGTPDDEIKENAKKLGARVAQLALKLSD